ncbi:IclR family transcriptional regulator [Microbaculum marinisediminis]|uniref:Helix-turn-helix domain-containing protein n=1 Tax=Microbaculum marinisediminis TaxID=2931392 RepID=A0AAW5QTB5_9HYPH|nr:IclR family transcriptional regulator C-terminal domain-containing protein [Microbaculum sp. A6E488]MCT8970908.1 helix-turn-helix domain-containing protein [Microbaculum sp. A6E488]
MNAIENTAARPKPRKEDTGDGRFLGSVEKTFQVLSAFNAKRKPLSLTEIVRLSGIEKSAAQRVVFTLRALGYIRQSETTRLYSLSARMLEFGASFIASSHLHEVAGPILEAVNASCEETVNLTEREGEDVVYVLRYPSRHVVSVDLSSGSRLPIYCTAPGRAILAYLDDEEARRILATSDLKSRTPTTKTDPEEILEACARVRAQGYSLTNQEAFVGDISVSAPVFDESGAVLAAVNIAVPWPRWSVERVEAELAPVVVGAANAISLAMRST